MKLLSRDDFREGVFARDGHRCVICGQPAADAHHIIERRLFVDGGYYLSNGASLCETHHLQAEMTTLSVEDIRRACGITEICLPEHLYADQPYDKWGNPILDPTEFPPVGGRPRRARGELFWDESVQKVLGQGGVLDLFTTYTKYPRTWHLPWSENIGKDDRILTDASVLSGNEIVMLEKMDGESSTLYTDYYHARSIDGHQHPSRRLIKSLRGLIAHEIPYGWRACLENMRAVHAIAYQNLDSLFYGLSVWDDRNNCLAYDEGLEWFDLLNAVAQESMQGPRAQALMISRPRELYRGPYDPRAIQAAWAAAVKERAETGGDPMEGYVIRVTNAFPYRDFRRSVAKFVINGHASKAKHWMYGRPSFDPNPIRLPNGELFVLDEAA